MTLITNRTQSDVDRVKYLAKRIRTGIVTEAEYAEYLSGMKGAYNASDLNRVCAVAEELAARFRAAGYNVSGYQRIRVAHPARLPAGYTEVEYIESSGTQYIDTGLVPDANTQVEMDFQLISPGTANHCLLGVAGQFSFRWYGSNSTFRSNGGGNVDFAAGIDAETRHTVVKTATQTIIDGTYSVTTTAATISLTLYLLAMHQASAAAQYASARLYACQIYNNGILVRDYVPCTNADGEVGLYDLANGAFYGNAGTGVFTAGAEVSPDSDAPDLYTWDEADVPTASQMRQYLANVEALRSRVPAMETTPDTPETMDGLTVDAANAIEQILIDTDSLLTRSQQAVYYSGEIYAGEI